MEFIATGEAGKEKFEQFVGVEFGRPRIIERIDDEQAAEAAAKGRA
ncbi:MAG: hypothetical protein AB7O39_00880 [Flavobacteriaceae bacterium]